MLRGIFGDKREEVTGGWRKLLDDIQNLRLGYASPNRPFSLLLR
jgi:hypothetical protein